MNIEPIAHIRTDFSQKFGIPRQSGRVPELQGRIVFLPKYRSPEALRGIEGFSHLWLLFDFSLAHTDGEWSPTVRPPRLGGNKRIGVFASRSPFRPNNIGLSSVKLLGIEHTEEGDTLLVSGADLLDGTPIYDIKPYLPYTDSHPDAVGGYAAEVQDYHLSVDFPPSLLSLLPENKRQAAVDCLADDPRPSYQDQPGRVYSMQFAGYDIRFTVAGEVLTVADVEKLR